MKNVTTTKSAPVAFTISHATISVLRNERDTLRTLAKLDPSQQQRLDVATEMLSMVRRTYRAAIAARKVLASV